MGSLIGIRRRIKSAKNISQTTKAMQMVSASKMRKAQNLALATRPFTLGLEQMLASATAKGINYVHPLLRKTNTSGKVLIIMISTNKGFCGGLNVNLTREMSEWLHNNNLKSLDIILVGKKAKTVFPGIESNVIARFETINESPTFLETRAIAKMAIDSFGDQTYDTIYLEYPKFISTLSNQITIHKLLPMTASPDDLDQADTEILIEPNPGVILESLLPYRVEMTVYQTIIETRASEHSARMVAMKNASDNATDLIKSLTLDYNQARQSQVTNELLDVTTARMALE